MGHFYEEHPLKNYEEYSYIYSVDSKGYCHSILKFKNNSGLKIDISPFTKNVREYSGIIIPIVFLDEDYFIDAYGGDPHHKFSGIFDNTNTLIEKVGNAIVHDKNLKKENNKWNTMTKK